MGCANSKTAPTSSTDPNEDFRELIENVQSTWPNIKKIENLGPKTIARLLHVYPILKRMSNVSGTLKTEADLLRVNEVRDLGNMLLALYSDIIKNAHSNLQQRIQSKAIVLQRQKIQPRLIKHFGESFYHIITHQINIHLTSNQKDSWLEFTNYLSDQLIHCMKLEQEYQE